MTKISNISRRRKTASASNGAEYAAKLQDIVATAAKLFNEQGYHATSLACVGEQVGLDRATLYYYIGSKEELLRKLVEGILDSNLAEAERQSALTAMSPRARITSLLEVLMQSYEDNYPQMYVYIQEQMHQVSKKPSAWAKEIQQKTRRFEIVVMALLQQGIDIGDFRDDIGVRLIANGIFGMFNWTHRWYRPGGELSARDIAAAYSRILFEGVEIKFIS